MPISYEMPVYKNRIAKRPLIKTESDFASASVYESKLEMNMHTGTHIDRPLHIFLGGDTIETLDLKKVVTACKVFDFSLVQERISQTHLESKAIIAGDFILLKTKNSTTDLPDEFIYLDASGAQYLKGKGIVGIGIDALGIEHSQPNHETYKTLLGAGIVILEGVNLADISEGEYLLIAAPINIVGAEAALVRAILLRDI